MSSQILSFFTRQGDTTDPQNYRPVSLLNTDYKILTKVIHNHIHRTLIPNAIPIEQMARSGIWGTQHGLMLDKSYTQIAKLNGREQHTAWYDFRKTFDTVNHAKIKQSINILKIPAAMKNTIKQAMGQWNACLTTPGSSATFPIKIGVYRGDSLGPLIFILVTARIINKIKTDPPITRLAKDEQKVIAFMDVIKCLAPNKPAIKKITSTIDIRTTNRLEIKQKQICPL